MAEIDKDHQRKVMHKVFSILKDYKQFRIEKKVSDHLLTSAVQNIAKKRMIKAWYSLAMKRQGLQMLADSFTVMKMRWLYKQGRFLVKQEKEVTNHLDLFREFLLLKRTFNGLVKYTRRRDYQVMRTKQCE